MWTALRVTLMLSISFCAAALNSVGECPFCLQWFEIDNHLYGVSEERTNYSIAKICCENQDGHIRLTILDSEVDGLFVMNNLVKQFPSRQFWVDAKRIDKINAFTWPNGSVVNESLWENNPNLNTTEDCVFVHTNGTLRRNGCLSGNFSVYCQAYRPPATITTYACEGNDLTIACPTGEYINIVHAFYGRSSVTACIDIPSHMTNLECNSTNAFGNITSKCNGQQSCEFKVTNDFFKDPCGGTSKYAQVVHACVTGNTSSLTSNTSSMSSITHSYQTEPSTQEIPTQPARCSSKINDFTTTATSYSHFTTVVKETTAMFETTTSPSMSTISVKLESQSTTMFETTTPASTTVTITEPNLPVSTPASTAVTISEPNLPVSTPASTAVTISEPNLPVSTPASTAVTISEPNLPVSTPASTAVTISEPNLPVSTPANTAVTISEPNLPVSTQASTAVTISEPNLPVSTPASTTGSISEPNLPVSTPASTTVTMTEPNLPVSTPASTTVTISEPNLPVSTPASTAVTMSEPNLPVSTRRYFCTCQMIKSLVNFSSEDNIQQIKKELYVNKTSLSSNVHKRTSSKDDRPSAQTIGWLGVFLLCVPVIFIVCFDLQRLLVHIQT